MDIRLKLLCSMVFFVLGMLTASFLGETLLKDIMISFISFTVGALLTFLIRDIITIKMTKQSTGLGVSLIVTFMWAVSIIAEIAIADFTVSPFIHGIMGVIAAFFFKDSGLVNGGK